MKDPLKGKDAVGIRVEMISREDVSLYNCNPSLAALTQVCMLEHADPQALFVAANHRGYTPYEPSALLICSGTITLMRLSLMQAVSVPQARALPGSHAARFEEEQ